MLAELKPNEYHKARPLFQAFDYSLSLPAALAGDNPGRIFVDDVENPQVAFALTVEGYFLSGDPDNPAAVETAGNFLREKIFSGEVYLDDDTNLSLAVTPPQWEARLPKMIPTHEVEKLPRYHYLCQELAFDWRAHLPVGYQVRAFDQALLDDPDLEIPEAIIEWACIEIRWGSWDHYLRHGVGTCVLHGDKVAAVSQPDCFAGDQIDIGIYTLPEYRRKGLAAVAAAANVEAAIQRGYRKVGWHCNTENIGSWKTAEKVGFKRHKTYDYYFYIFDEIDHLAELGWFYFKQAQYQKTVDYYERVFAARDDHPDYYYHLAAVAWAALDEAEKALQYLNAAVDHGWRARDWTEQEEKFEFLHDSPEWKAVLKRMDA
jgi:RimJ/RimL family protein N-acetyltransferase